MAQACSNCGSDMQFFQAGVSNKTGQPYNPSWRCPNKCQGTTQWVKPPGQQPQRPQAPQQPARQPQRTPATFDSRERSIAAQACAKAACEAVAGLGLISSMGMSESQVMEFTVTLARRLYNDFVIPATRGVQHPSVAGPADEPPPIEDEDLGFQ